MCRWWTIWPHKNPSVFSFLNTWAHFLHAFEYEEDTHAVAYLINMSRKVSLAQGL